MISPTSSAVDGYIGFSTLKGTGYSWNETASVSGSTSGTGSRQFDLEATPFHEISEVMGRIAMEGEMVNGKTTYTPLDLFNYQSHGVLELSGNGGSFSFNDGTTDQGTYNNASANGGDIADWASAASPTQSGTFGLPGGVNVYDAYDAFAFPGYNGDLFAERYSRRCRARLSADAGRSRSSIAAVSKSVGWLKSTASPARRRASDPAKTCRAAGARP